MDLVHKFLNLTLPVLSLMLFIIFFPPLLLFKLLNSLRSIFPEKLAGKVVLITGASSGIGEYLAYEYAKRGACLALIARTEDRLQLVAGKARQLGSPDVTVIPADVSKLEDCRKFVDETVNHFGRLDHLVNNAGIAPLCFFEDYTCVSDHASIMNINFWGSVYSTQFALPHLKKSKGKMIVISSCGEWFATPRLSVYNASKAALVIFYETLRVELGSDIGITIVTPGIIQSEITNSDWLSQAKLKFVPMESTEGCAKAIVNSASRGDKYLTEPAWMKVLFLWKVFCPDVFEWFNRLVLTTRPNTCSQRDATSTKMMDASSTQALEFKTD